jgi:hypothetical protein
MRRPPEVPRRDVSSDENPEPIDDTPDPVNILLAEWPPYGDSPNTNKVIWCVNRSSIFIGKQTPPFGSPTKWEIIL